MNLKRTFNKGNKQYIFGIALISLITLVSSKLITPPNTFFDETISIEYIGQVEGFPVEDVVTYNYTPTNENNGRINFTMSRGEFNPYDLSASYTVSKTSEKIEIDLKSVIHPMNLEANSNTQITSLGDKIDLPNTLNVGQKLENKNGSLTFVINENATKRINIEVKNRNVIAKENITVNELEYETYQLNYTVITQKFYNDVLFETTTENIQEWILPGVGFLKRISSAEGSYYSNDKITNSYNTRFTLTAQSME